MEKDVSGYVDSTEHDNTEEKDSDSDTFGPGPVERDRCGKCGSSFITETEYEGFTVPYCEVDEKPLCPECYYPALESFKSNNASGIYCKKCGKSWTHSQS